MNRTVILNNEQIAQKINRIAYQIYENNYEEKEIIVAGISGNGYMLAEKIVSVLRNISPLQITLCTVHLNKANPLEQPITCDLDSNEISNKVILVVDDVLESGKTLIYGVRYFLDFPVKRIRTVVLVDRSHRSYPIKADYVGMTLATTLQEHIRVIIEDQNDQAILI